MSQPDAALRDKAFGDSSSSQTKTAMQTEPCILQEGIAKACGLACACCALRGVVTASPELRSLPMEQRRCLKPPLTASPPAWQHPAVRLGPRSRVDTSLIMCKQRMFILPHCHETTSRRNQRSGKKRPQHRGRKSNRDANRPQLRLQRWTTGMREKLSNSGTGRSDWRTLGGSQQPSAWSGF